MAESLKRHWRFVRYLLFPSNVLFGFMVLIAAVSAAIGVLGYLTLHPAALRVAGIFILVVFTVNLFHLPVQLNQLLRSRAWVLCPGGIRQPVSVAIGLLVVWCLALALATQGVGSASFLPAALVFWGLASVFIALGAWAQMSVFVMAIFFLIAGQLPEEFDLSAQLEKLPVFWSLLGGALGGGTWWWLVRRARLGRLSPACVPVHWGHSFGGGQVVVKGGPVHQFAQSAVLSSHPFLKLFGVSLLTSFVVVVLALGNRYLEGKALWPWLFSEASFHTLGLFVLIMAGAMAIVGIQSLYRRVPGLWLMLGGDRLAFYRYLICIQWGLFAAAFVPVLIFGAGFIWQLDLPLWRLALMVLAWIVVTMLVLHWSNYIIGNDNPWLSVIGLVVIMPALLLAVAAGLVMPLLVAGVSLVALVAVGVVVRHVAYQRWRRIDLGALRSVRSG